MMTTTINEILKLSPCTSGIKNLLKQVGSGYDKDRPIDIAKLVGGENELSDITWLLAKMDKKPILVKLAIYSAELVLHLYEKNNSGDGPRKAIEAAKEYLKNPSSENKDKLRSARCDAYAAAATYAAAYAVDAATYAAYAAAAAYAADAVDAAYAAYAVDAAADAVDAAAYAAAYAARKEIKNKINAKLIELIN